MNPNSSKAKHSSRWRRVGVYMYAAVPEHEWTSASLFLAEKEFCFTSVNFSQTRGRVVIGPEHPPFPFCSVGSTGAQLLSQSSLISSTWQRTSDFITMSNFWSIFSLQSKIYKNEQSYFVMIITFFHIIIAPRGPSQRQGPQCAFYCTSMSQKDSLCPRDCSLGKSIFCFSSPF